MTDNKMKLNKMKCYIFFCILFLFIQPINAQSLKRQSLSSIGSSIDKNGYFIRQTIGQASNTQIFTGQNYSLRQGFQQPQSLSNGKTKDVPCSVSLYPNPAHSNSDINIDLGSIVQNYDFYITDMEGKILLKEFNLTQDRFKLKLPLLSQGVYLLIIRYNTGKTCTSKFTITNE